MGLRPPQAEHSSLHGSGSGCCGRQRGGAREAAAQCHVAAHVGQRRRLAGGAGRRAATPSRATAAAAAAPPPTAERQLPAAEVQQQQQLGWDMLPSSSGGLLLDATLAADDGDVVSFLVQQYKVGEKRQVAPKAQRALAALAADGGGQALSLERDVLPKLELLEGLSPGLGWKVFRRYPEQFGSPEALECWRIMAAYLYTVGIPPDKISALFVRHHSLFHQSVADPDNLRRLFSWLQADLGLAPHQMLKVIDRCPRILQLDVEAVLKPRVQFFVDLGMPQSRVVTGILRAPEVLGIDTAVLAAKADFYTSQLALTRHDLGQLYVSDPSAILVSLASLEGTVVWLREELGLEGELLTKVAAKGAVLKYPLTTLQERVAFWRELGFSSADLRHMLCRLPRLLLLPMRDPKYQLKLRFLTEELGLAIRPSLLVFPQFLTYSLPGRIAPRFAAARALPPGCAPRRMPFSRLAAAEAGFVRWLQVAPEEWCVFEEKWQRSPEAVRWGAAATAVAAAEDGSGEEQQQEEQQQLKEKQQQEEQ